MVERDLEVSETSVRALLNVTTTAVAKSPVDQQTA